jgi:hypothetical protein
MMEIGQISNPPCFKMSGLCEKKNVTHDGACGYRCIAELCNIPLNDVISSCSNLCNDPSLSKINGLVEWCDNLSRELDIFPKKKSLSASAYLHTDIILMYASKYKCLFILVRLQPSQRNCIEFLTILPSKPYESTDKLIVLLHEGIKFDCIVPIAGKEDEFEEVFRNAAEVLIIVII